TILVTLAAPLGLASLLPEGVPGIGETALSTFVWSAVPSVITGLIAAGVVWRSGGLSWVVAAAVAIIAFALAATLLPLHLHDARPYLAFLAGLVSIAVRQALIQADIIPG